MPQINPIALKSLRTRRNWSLDELAAEAKVDRGTINKIETGKRANPRGSTVRKIANALGVEPDDLASTDIDDSERLSVQPKSQLNIRMTNAARNALHLTAVRYGVSQSHIVHLAPLLFRWAAEQSLQWRRTRLENVSAQIDILANVAVPQHLSGVLTDHWRGNDIIQDEHQSIERRDLFGQLLMEDTLKLDYEEGEQNPMAQFLKTVASSLGNDVEFDHWSPSWGQPSYELGMEEALELVGGDTEAANDIVRGFAPLHELPKNVREQGGAAIAQWAKEASQREIRKIVDVDALFAGLEIEND